MDRHPQRALDRLIAFSDAIVAIAMTLLVLPLTAIEPSQYADLGELLSKNSATLYAFLLSFFVIASYWDAHHRMFDRLVRMDGRLVRLNMVWVLAIVFLPFPTSLLQNEGGQTYMTFYLVSLFVTALITRLLGLYIDLHPGLTDGDPDRSTRLGGLRGWLLVVVFGVATLVSLRWPTAAGYLLFLCLLAGPLAARLVTDPVAP